MPPEEIWRPVADAPDYEVSNLGRVRSWKPLHRSSRPVIEPRIMRTSLNDSGYEYLLLCVGEKRVPKKVHRLVAEAFCPGKSETNWLVRHLNDRRRDNRAENLAWGTAAENREDQYRNGVGVHGQRCTNSKLTDEQAREIFADETSTCAVLAAKYGVSPMTISDIRSKRSRKRSLGPGPKSPGACGSGRNPRRKITPRQAAEILVCTEPLGAVADRFGISTTVVHKIWTREDWPHLDPIREGAIAI